MYNRDLVIEDRFSELPEALILQILSLLPTILAIRTSVLSKQWKSHWRMLPNLKFNSYDHRKFSKNVWDNLVSHKAPVLQSLHLNIRLDRCNELDTQGLIIIALARNVRQLVLELHGEVFPFPKILYNCGTLKTLKLWFMILIDIPSIVCLKSLKSLHLYHVDFIDKESLINLLSGCPNLEDLIMSIQYPFTRVETFTIALPFLQRLTILDYSELRLGYVINAPSLKYLKIDGILSLDYCLIENVTKLVEANLIVASLAQIICENHLGSLTSVKRLSLKVQSPLMIKSPTGSIIFYQLAYLELHTHKPVCWNLLTLMLESSPKLQILKLIDSQPIYRRKKDLSNRGEWNQPKSVPQCLLFHLETFIWKGYEWEREEQKKVAIYILRNTNHLKRAIFFSKPVDPKERVEMVEDLNSMVRASNSCQLLVK